MSDTFFDNQTIPENKLQKLDDLFLSVKKERLKDIKNNIFLDCILEATTSSYGIKEMLAVKIKDIILREELIYASVRRGDKTDSSIGLLLDVEEFNNVQLSFGEEKDLKNAVEQRIQEKANILVKELDSLTNSGAQATEKIISDFKSDLRNAKDDLIFWQRKLKEGQEIYAKAMLLLSGKLQELLQMKTETVPELLAEHSDEMGLNYEKFRLKMSILEHNLRLLTLGDGLPTDIYKTAFKDLTSQQEKCLKEIEKLTALKENYANIAKTQEFKDILHDFRQYKRGIEKKTWIYNEISNKKE